LLNIPLQESYDVGGFIEPAGLPILCVDAQARHLLFASTSDEIRPVPGVEQDVSLLNSEAHLINGIARSRAVGTALEVIQCKRFDIGRHLGFSKNVLVLAIIQPSTEQNMF